MSASTLPVPHSNRSLIEQDGIRHLVYIHDQFYKQEKISWKLKLASVHPDRAPRGGAWRFLKIAANYRAWMNKERVYYWRLGLMPPDWSGTTRPPPGWTISQTRRIEQ